MPVAGVADRDRDPAVGRAAVVTEIVWWSASPSRIAWAALTSRLRNTWPSRDSVAHTGGTSAVVPDQPGAVPDLVERHAQGRLEHALDVDRVPLGPSSPAREQAQVADDVADPLDAVVGVAQLVEQLAAGPARGRPGRRPAGARARRSPSTAASGLLISWATPAARVPTDGHPVRDHQLGLGLLLSVMSRATTTAPTMRPSSRIGPKLHEYQASVAVGAGPHGLPGRVSPARGPPPRAAVTIVGGRPAGRTRAHDRPTTSSTFSPGTSRLMNWIRPSGSVRMIVSGALWTSACHAARDRGQLVLGMLLAR